MTVHVFKDCTNSIVISVFYCLFNEESILIFQELSHELPFVDKSKYDDFDTSYNLDSVQKLVDEYSDESIVSVADLAIGTSSPVWIITMVQRGGVSKE